MTWSARDAVRRHRTLFVVAVTFAALTTGSVAVRAAAQGLALTPRTYSVGLTRCTFVDPSRDVLDYSSTPPTTLASQRSLQTEIRYPSAVSSTGTQPLSQATPAVKASGFPLVVFAHGYDVMPDTYAALLDYWAARGYVVVAPIFPDENQFEVARQNGANTEGDLVNEPADMAFVAHQVILDSAAPTSGCPLLAGLVDSSVVAVTGHSDGGVAAGLLANSMGRDPQGVSFQSMRHSLHLRAAIVMSGDEDGKGPYVAQPFGPALLVVQSAADRCNAPNGAVRLYRDVHQGNKWFLELLRAHHLPPYDNVDRAAFNVVSVTTTAFLDLTLNSSARASALLDDGNARPLVARIFHGGSGPTLTPPKLAPLCALN